MAEELTALKIRTETLGTVSEIRGFLTDMENAYNGLYVFDFIVVTLQYDFKRREDRYYDRVDKYRMSPRDFLYSRIIETLPNLIELESKINFQTIVLSSETLSLSKISIQSPGFWEFVGSLNPLQQIREFLKDHHERKKDNKFRSAQEKRKGELEILEKEDSIIKERIQILKDIGYSDLEIRPLVTKLITNPLQTLGGHQATGLIEAPVANNQSEDSNELGPGQRV